MKLGNVSSVELSEADLESVYGGLGIGSGLGTGLGTGLGDGLGAGLGLGASTSTASDERVHSFSVLCDINIFSINAIVLPIVNIATQTTQACANDN